MIFREQRKAIWNIKDVFSFVKIVKSYQFSLCPKKSCPMHGWERISKWFSERDWFLQDSKTCQLAFPSGFLRYPIDLLWLNTTYYDDSPLNLSLVHTVFEPFNFYIFQISFCDVLWALHTQQWRNRKRWAKNITRNWVESSFVFRLWCCCRSILNVRFRSVGSKDLEEEEKKGARKIIFRSILSLNLDVSWLSTCNLLYLVCVVNIASLGCCRSLCTHKYGPKNAILCNYLSSFLILLKAKHKTWSWWSFYCHMLFFSSGPLSKDSSPLFLKDMAEHWKKNQVT